MPNNSQFTNPLIVDETKGESYPLQPVAIEVAGRYDEKWLQDVIYDHASVLPIEDLEPVFGGTLSVCKELPTNVGPLDVFCINDQGLPTLVECKLWRNPEARRKVVGQILDYAQEISRWSYEELDGAVKRSQRKRGASLWEIARTAFDLTDEALFIDRVSRNLRAGRFLLLVVGDGIRENTENIAAFLQRSPGLSFAFGLVEQKLFDLPGSSGILVQPRILGKTVELGRFVVAAENGAVFSGGSGKDQSPESAQPRTVSEETFIEEIAGTSSLAGRIRNFFTRLKEAGFELDPSARGASFRIVPKGLKKNLMTLARDGTVRNHGCGNSQLGQQYLESLVRVLPGSQIRIGTDNGWSSTILKSDGSRYSIEEILGHEDDILSAFARAADLMRAANEE